MDMYKQAVCSSLRKALEDFLTLQDQDGDRHKISVAGRKVSDLTSVLEEIEKKERSV